MSDFREIVFSPIAFQGLADEDFPSIVVDVGIVPQNHTVTQNGSSVSGASFNFVNSIVGAGMIGKLGICVKRS